MNRTDLARINTVIRNEGVACYRIHGLNLFAANTMQGNSKLITLQMIPALTFLGALAKQYETVCLLGSPAPDNWRNQMQRERKSGRLEDLLGKEKQFSVVHISYYGGTFRAEQKYGPSLLFKLCDQNMLSKLGDPFLGWDSLALLMYAKGKNGLLAAQNALNGFTTEGALLESLLQEARWLILTQADCQYLEAYTRAADVENELNLAIGEAEAFIKGTDWYQKNKTNLIWDETQLCHVRRN